MSSSDDYNLAPLGPDEEGGGQEAECPVCKAKLTRSAVLCVSCGYHLVSGQMLAAQSRPQSQVVEQVDEQEPAENKSLDMCVRVFGWSWLAAPACFLIFFIVRLVASGGFFSVLDTMGLAVAGFVGFLGYIVGRNGADFGTEANEIRVNGVIYLVIGIVSIVASIAIAFVIRQTPMLILGIGVAAGLMVGTMMCATGLAIILMGRRLSEASL